MKLGDETVTVYEEDKIPLEFGTAYNQTKLHEGYSDDDDFPEPYRFIKQWFLTKNTSKLYRRVPLNPNGTFEASHILYGFLQAVDPKANPAFVCISKLDHWTIDRSISLRGIWVRSTGPQKAWYWLQEPCSIQPTLPLRIPNATASPLIATLPSMQELNLLVRALFGAVSNLSDIFSEASQEISTESMYLPVHIKRKPADLFALLSSPNDDFYRRHSPNNMFPKTPFDLDLVETHPEFCRTHLKDFHPKLTSNSVFIKGLDALMKIKVRRQWTPAQLQASAEAAEERSQRNAWGRPYSNAKEVRPNWKLEADLNEAMREHLKQQQHEEAIPVYSDEDEVEVLAEPKQRVNLKRKGPTRDDDDEDDDKVAGKPKPQKKSKSNPTQPTSNESSNEEPKVVPKSKPRKNNKREEQILVEDSDDEPVVVVQTKKRKKSVMKETHAEVVFPQKSVPKNKALSAKVTGKSKAPALFDSDSDGSVLLADDENTDATNEIFIYSEHRMKEALLSIRSALQPLPSLAANCSWDRVSSAKYIFIDLDSAEGVFNRMLDFDTWEWRLLLVSLFSNACKHMQVEISKKCFNDKKCPAKIVSEDWRKDALRRIQSVPQLKGSTPELFLITTMEYVVHCEVIKSVKVFDLIKAKKGVDWESGVKDTMVVARRIGCKNLIHSCTLARQRIDDIKSGNTLEQKKLRTEIEMNRHEEKKKVQEDQKELKQQQELKQRQKEELDNGRRERLEKMKASMVAKHGGIVAPNTLLAANQESAGYHKGGELNSYNSAAVSAVWREGSTASSGIFSSKGAHRSRDSQPVEGFSSHHDLGWGTNFTHKVQPASRGKVMPMDRFGGANSKLSGSTELAPPADTFGWGNSHSSRKPADTSAPPVANLGWGKSHSSSKHDDASAPPAAALGWGKSHTSRKHDDASAPPVATLGWGKSHSSRKHDDASAPPVATLGWVKSHSSSKHDDASSPPAAILGWGKSHTSRKPADTSAPPAATLGWGKSYSSSKYDDASAPSAATLGLGNSHSSSKHDDTSAPPAATLGRGKSHSSSNHDDASAPPAGSVGWGNSHSGRNHGDASAPPPDSFGWGKSQSSSKHADTSAPKVKLGWGKPSDRVDPALRESISTTDSLRSNGLAWAKKMAAHSTESPRKIGGNPTLSVSNNIPARENMAATEQRMRKGYTGNTQIAGPESRPEGKGRQHSGPTILEHHRTEREDACDKSINSPSNNNPRDNCPNVSRNSVNNSRYSESGRANWNDERRPSSSYNDPRSRNDTAWQHDAPRSASSSRDRNDDEFGRSNTRSRIDPLEAVRFVPVGSSYSALADSSDFHRLLDESRKAELDELNRRKGPTSTSSHHNPSLDNHASTPRSQERSVGQGRGADKNLPAWLTRQGNDGPRVASPPALSVPTAPAPIQSTTHRNLQQGIGRGRGRAINLPAWMTQQKGQDGSAPVTVVCPAPIQAPAVAAFVQPPVQPLGRGRGMGRTVPAWMTGDDNGSGPVTPAAVATAVVNVTQQSNRPPAFAARDNPSGGRGRGAHLNLPAWMTRGS